MKTNIRSVCWVLLALVLVLPVHAGVNEYMQTVKTSGEHTWLKAKVFISLVLQPGVSAWNTSVQVEDSGAVTISGPAESQAQANLTELVVKRHASKVVSNMEAPKSTVLASGFQDTVLTLKVYSALAVKPLLNTNIRVEVMRDSVALTGTTYSTAEKELAEEMAKAVNGVARVTNLLRVIGPS